MCKRKDAVFMNLERVIPLYMKDCIAVAFILNQQT